jgi:hypothetical protein
VKVKEPNSRRAPISISSKKRMTSPMRSQRRGG